MHISTTKINGNSYCYVADCIWNSNDKSYDKSKKLIGKLDSEGNFTPNKYLNTLLLREANDEDALSQQEKAIIATARKYYGSNIKAQYTSKSRDDIENNIIQTASVINYGPQLVFGSLAKKLKVDSMLINAMGDKLGHDVLSLSWYIASEGSALSNNDSWLDYFENPRGSGLSSQEISKLLDAISFDNIMTFYKLWLKNFTRTDKVLYDLTSISYYGSSIHAADWGYNRDHESLPQVNYALLCVRNTAMPLFAWPLTGSISDVSTLETTLEFLNKLGYKPNCVMMDRGFASKDNIGYLLQHGYIFLQALKVNANWIYDIIDAGELTRLNPDSMLKVDNRTYYSSTVNLQLVRWKKRNGKKAEEESFFYHCRAKHDYYESNDSKIEVLKQYPCQAHVLFCQDLVGNSWDRFMLKLKYEHIRLINDESANVKPEYAAYFTICKPKYARKRSVEYNMTAIDLHKNKYIGYICFLSNDPTIKTAEDALAEYSTRDYIEKDFDEMKNDLDMYRLRIHSDNRMRARLFIQFIAEIFLREIRFKLKASADCSKMTKTQIFAHIKAISKVHFNNKYNDVIPALSKNQRNILAALDIRL